MNYIIAVIVVALEMKKSVDAVIVLAVMRVMNATIIIKKD